MQKEKKKSNSFMRYQQDIRQALDPKTYALDRNDKKMVGKIVGRLCTLSLPRTKITGRSYISGTRNLLLKIRSPASSATDNPPSNSCLFVSSPKRSASWCDVQ